MGVGKYYCDYCEKQFQDTPFARKRHLQSLTHHKAKALWFDSFPSNNASFATTTTRLLLCNRFITTGFCQYGDSCKYFHPNNNNQQYSSSHPIPGGIVSDRMGTSWGNLPPSLMPPPEGGYQPLPFVDWG